MEIAMQQQQQQPAAKPKKKIKVVRPVNGIDQEVEIEVDADSGPGWGPNDKHTILNHAMPRVDGPLKVSGRSTLHPRHASERDVVRSHTSFSVCAREGNEVRLERS
jgi:hypothetical protein